MLGVGGPKSLRWKTYMQKAPYRLLSQFWISNIILKAVQYMAVSQIKGDLIQVKSIIEKFRFRFLKTLIEK